MVAESESVLGASGGQAERFGKVIVARHDERMQCFAASGEWLIAASPTVASPLRFRRDAHFFVGLETGQPSLYGWVESPGESFEVDLPSLTRMVLKCPESELIGDSVEEVTAQIRFTLTSIERIPLSAPAVCDFSFKSVFDKTPVQKIHRVFL